MKINDIYTKTIEDMLTKNSHDHNIIEAFILLIPLLSKACLSMAHGKQTNFPSFFQW
jgi:hypothetical protein